MKKVFLQTQFGSPHEWTEKYFTNIKTLEEHGWYWKIFTPNKYKSEGNLEIIPMDIHEFDALLYTKLGLKVANRIVGGRPYKYVSDYYVAQGRIFEDFIKGFDFWGHTNWDMVYGRLDHFLPDSFLKDCEIFSDDPNELNGIFSLYRNNEKINNLFKKIPNWEAMMSDIEHLYVTDEHEMTKVVFAERDAGKLQLKTSPEGYWHMYDPKTYLRMKMDGSLWGNQKEIMTFHFNRTKVYPKL